MQASKVEKKPHGLLCRLMNWNERRICIRSGTPVSSNNTPSICVNKQVSRPIMNALCRRCQKQAARLIRQGRVQLSYEPTMQICCLAGRMPFSTLCPPTIGNSWILSRPCHFGWIAVWVWKNCRFMVSVTTGAGVTLVGRITQPSLACLKRWKHLPARLTCRYSSARESVG